MNFTGTGSRDSKIQRAKLLKTNQLSCEFVGSFYDIGQLPDNDLPQIALAGRSNVGKSSLLNRLVGQKRLAKVSSTPGKTRSINFFSVNKRFYFVDLPGYGYAKVSKTERESWGVLLEKYLTESKQLIGMVLLIDSRRKPTEEDLMLAEWLEIRKLPVIIALTKADKLGRGDLNNTVRAIQKEFNVEVIPFSIMGGLGKNEILRAVTNLVASGT